MINTKLADVVNISRQFQRSIHLDADYGKSDSLLGYICQGTAKSVLENTARQILESNQRAFTWTGPYGGGKSSLALGLCSLVHTDSKIRKLAVSTLGLEDNNLVLSAFESKKKGWLVMPVVGKRSSVVQSLYLALQKSKKIDGSTATVTADELLKSLEVESELHDGVLIVIDELGKFLESALQNNEDIYFYQQLAEFANRSKGKVLVVGILHQAFEQYANKLGRETRDEWSKIQGRYVDIPLISASDELVALTGKAISTDFKHPKSKGISQKIAEQIRIRRPAVSNEFWESLDNCWPLHPVTAALLGPTSKRRFGQNERSAFSFLVSIEPKGFKDFLLSNDAHELNYYLPSTYWDYLKFNLEPAILASPDSHRWAQAAEAVERSESTGGQLHVSLTKTIAMIELFKNGSGLSPDHETIYACLPSYSKLDINAALEALKHRSIITYRKHLEAWGIFAGSDFDIDGALHEALLSISEPDLNQLSKLTNLYPSVAKRHYFKTGTLRWMNVELCNADKIKQKVTEFDTTNRAFGAFILIIPNRDNSDQDLENLCKLGSKNDSKYPIVVGSPKNGAAIKELSRELLGLEFVRKNRPEHEGDPIARREIDGRVSSIRSQLENELREAFINATWYLQGKKIDNPGISGLSSLTSNLADKLFENTPNIFSELINRDKLSGTSSKARRDLLHAMVLNEKMPDLGFEGFPPEAGMYHSVIKSVGIHRQNKSGEFSFMKPLNQGNGNSFQSLWNVTEKLVTDSNRSITLEELYEIWTLPPYGLKEGILPVIAFAFILANKDKIAIYKDNMFSPEIGDVIVDEALQSPSRITLKYVQIDLHRKSILEGISRQLKEKLNINSSIDPLNAARTLVGVMFKQPTWTQRTMHITSRSRQVRDVLLRASDPHKVLFVDLPTIFASNDPDEYIELLGDALKEITDAYDKKLSQVVEKMMLALDANLDQIESIKLRAKTVSGITGDFRLDGFAARLTVFEKNRSFYEGLLGLAVNKPTRDWNDQDADLALITLADWALKFRQIEAISSIRDRNPTRKAIAVVFGTGEEGETISDSFSISLDDQTKVNELAAQLDAHSKNISPEIFLAALAQAGANALHKKGINHE